jgi:acyl-CoA thioesterase-1
MVSFFVSNWVVYHVASGQSFFSGVILLIVAAFLSRRTMSMVLRCSRLTFVLGAVALSISSTPLPTWFGAIVIAAIIFWVVSTYMARWATWARVALITTWTLAILLEAPYHRSPQLVPTASRSLTVIGDSITAGMGTSDKTVRWPVLLAESHGLIVEDLSQPGATTASALKTAKARTINGQWILLEIGGNDVLGDTSIEKYSADLDGLLAHVSASGRLVLMFELPLPPFRSDFAHAQRTIAKKYDVLLIPKRVLLSILTSENSTVDTIHLTQVGHSRMAATVWELIRSGLVEENENEKGATNLSTNQPLELEQNEHQNRREHKHPQRDDVYGKDSDQQTNTFHPIEPA